MNNSDTETAIPFDVTASALFPYARISASATAGLSGNGLEWGPVHAHICASQTSIKRRISHQELLNALAAPYQRERSALHAPSVAIDGASHVLGSSDLYTRELLATSHQYLQRARLYHEEGLTAATMRTAMIESVTPTGEFVCPTGMCAPVVGTVLCSTARASGPHSVKSSLFSSPGRKR